MDPLGLNSAIPQIQKDLNDATDKLNADIGEALHTLDNSEQHIVMLAQSMLTKTVSQAISGLGTLLQAASTDAGALIDRLDGAEITCTIRLKPGWAKPVSSSQKPTP